MTLGPFGIVAHAVSAEIEITKRRDNIIKRRMALPHVLGRRLSRNRLPAARAFLYIGIILL